MVGHAQKYAIRAGGSTQGVGGGIGFLGLAMALNRKYDDRNNAFSDWMRDVGRKYQKRSRPKQIDLDGLWYCDECKELLFLCEAEIYHDRHLSRKTTTIGLALAVRANLPFYMIQNHLDPKNDEVIVKLTIQRQFDPERGPSPIWEKLDPDRAEDWVMSLYDKHEEVCKRPTGLRWDRVLRKEVRQKLKT